MNPTTVCTQPDGEICHRFSPGKEGDEICLRCAHIEVCHTPLDKYAGGNTLLCWYRRDDKTVETCRKKFMDAVDFAEGPKLPEVGPGCIDPESGFATNGQLVPRQTSGNPAYRMTVELDPALKPDRMIFRNESAPGLTLDGVKRAQTHIAIMSGIMDRARDQDLQGYTLRRIWVRPGEWERLTRDLARFHDERARAHYEPAQVGAFFVEGAGNVPVCEHPWLPEKIAVRLGNEIAGPGLNLQLGENRRVICMLEYGRSLPIVYGQPPYAPVLDNYRLRILTE